MSDRERKRAARRKRKRRSAERTEPGSPDAVTAPAPAPAPQAESFQERMARRYEERNAEARAKLEPLERGERPRAVTVGAVISTLIAVVFTVSIVLAIAGVKAKGQNVSPAPLIVFSIVAWGMAIGMWRARYWAVLGFQTLLVLVLIASGLGLVQVRTVPEALASVALLGGSGALFYFMIRAMARIQMPSGPEPR